jgi:hypothetical protein
VPPQIVVDVAEVEVRLEEVVIETQGAFIERLRLGQFVARIADVGEVDDRGDQVRIVVQRLAVGARRFLLPIGVPSSSSEPSRNCCSAGVSVRVPSSVTSAIDDFAAATGGCFLRERDDARRFGVEPKSNASWPCRSLCREQRARKLMRRSSSLGSDAAGPDPQRELRAAAPLPRGDEAPLLR